MEYIHEDVLREFSGSFIKGFVNLMLELGFDPNLKGLLYSLNIFMYFVALFLLNSFVHHFSVKN